MNNNTYLQIGKLFFAFSICALGIVQLVNGAFLKGLLPFNAAFPGKIVLVYINGLALIAASVLILTKKYTFQGTLLAGAIWLIWLLALHIPLLIMTYNVATEWTPTFEVAGFVSGALILMAVSNASVGRQFNLIRAGSYIFAVGLIVFFVLHIKYAAFIATLIPAWVPQHLFFAYFVGGAFLITALSIFTRFYVRLCTGLLGLMFLIWFFILHLPRVITDWQTEPEWTSMFVVIGFSGVAFLIASTTFSKPKYG
jgi:hypothetical protein